MSNSMSRAAFTLNLDSHFMMSFWYESKLPLICKRPIIPPMTREEGYGSAWDAADATGMYMPKVLQKGLSKSLILLIRLCFECLVQTVWTRLENDSTLPVAYLRRRFRSCGSIFWTCACHARVLASVVKLQNRKPCFMMELSEKNYID